MFLSRVCVVLLATSSLAHGQVLRVAELTGEELRALDRQKTVVILPGGILEEHGPHLPSYSDGFQNEYITARVARTIAQRPGWKALVFPQIPLGTAGANVIGGHFTWPGTYTVRSTTLRSIFMDLATELGDQGFHWVFIVHGHGAPHHNRALDEAADFFHDTYGGRMVHLLGIKPDSSRFDSVYARIPRAAREEDAGSTHAGLVETSELWHLRPDLIGPNVRTLATIAAANADQRKAVAESSAWPGYFGAPRRATREIGRSLLEAEAQDYATLALRILDGYNERTIARYADQALAIPQIRAVVDRALAQERVIEKREQDWLNKSGRGDSVEAEISVSRERWNDAIARRDSAAFRALLSATYSATNGFSRSLGPDSAVVGAAQLFRQRADLDYVARPTRVRVVVSHGVASEYGEWVEHWREPTGLTEMRGTYYAVWRRYDGRWLIESEINVPESCTGSDYCKPPNASSATRR